MTFKISRVMVCCVVSCMFVIACASFALAGVDEVKSGMLVATGKKCHFIAEQAEGKVYVVYADNEKQLLADGFGYICGMAAAPDNSVYVMSHTSKRLFRATPDGKVQMVRKVDEVPRAILVDRDGMVRFVTHGGAVHALK
ncbi:hypothetical protein [Maridesulfovibrio frigidus]|uniref:hypothetical protein n=1 Tax=Maridesulfovibrio frigidus TaxID=340956 RepID=UPI0004E0FE40|nr:hypothetical protein [Maridesulfovibrio frigidus]